MTYDTSRHKVQVSRSGEGHVVVRMVTTRGLKQDLAHKRFRFT